MNIQQIDRQGLLRHLREIEGKYPLRFVGQMT